jgi:hypothetical protein
MFWALFNVLGLVAALKRAVERMTLRHCERRRMRKLKLAAERAMQVRPLRVAVAMPRAATLAALPQAA